MSPNTEIAEFEWLDTITDLMDTKLRIPFTGVKFGADAVLGLIPVAGEVASFSVSGLMVLSMVRHGVSGKVIVLMLFNILLDAVIGAIPLLGTVFNIFYKANVRNLNLLREHQEQGEHGGSGIGIILAVLAFLVFCVFALIWGLWFMVTYLWGLLPF